MGIYQRPARIAISIKTEEFDVNGEPSVIHSSEAAFNDCTAWNEILEWVLRKGFPDMTYVINDGMVEQILAAALAARENA